MPRRPWRSLNALSASPMRVPLDQSGAAAAARWIARSGLRERSARVSRVSRVANTNASAFGPAAGGAGQELQVGPRVGLHRARDVAQQHEAPRDDAPAPAREPDRVAAGAQAAAQRAAQVDPLAVAAASRSGACAAAAWPARARSSAGRARPARPASSASKRLLRSTSSSLAIASGISTSLASSSSLAGASRAAARASPRSVVLGRGGRRATWPSSSDLGRRLVGRARRRPRRTRASKAATCASLGDEHARGRSSTAAGG